MMIFCVILNCDMLEISMEVKVHDNMESSQFTNHFGNQVRVQIHKFCDH